MQGIAGSRPKDWKPQREPLSEKENLLEKGVLERDMILSQGTTDPMQKVKKAMLAKDSKGRIGDVAKPDADSCNVQMSLATVPRVNTAWILNLLFKKNEGSGVSRAFLPGQVPA